MLYPHQEIQQRLIGLSDETSFVLGAAILARRHVLIRGKHGCGKSTFCRIAARYLGLRSDEWQYYDASKDDLVSVAGVPDVKSFAGCPDDSHSHHDDLKFLAHRRTIWNKKMVMIDEITRASPESQNIWLEVVGNQSLFGRPLPYEFLVATCNPSTYTATYELDDALLDRFAIVCDFPSLDEIPSYLLPDLVLVNMEGTAEEDAGDAHFERSIIMKRFAAARAELMNDADVRDAIVEWSSGVATVFLREKGQWSDCRVDSPTQRTIAEHLARVGVDLIAYDAITRSQVGGAALADCAIKMVLSQRLQWPEGLVDAVERRCSPVIAGIVDGPLSRHLRVVLGLRPREIFAAEDSFEYLVAHRAELSDNDRFYIEMSFRKLLSAYEDAPDGIEWLEHYASILAPSVARDMELERVVSRVREYVDGNEMRREPH